jgi:hypothetical protein
MVLVDYIGILFTCGNTFGLGPRCSSAETQVCHRSYIIAASLFTLRFHWSVRNCSRIRIRTTKIILQSIWGWFKLIQKYFGKVWLLKSIQKWLHNIFWKNMVLVDYIGIYFYMWQYFWPHAVYVQSCPVLSRT